MKIDRHPGIPGPHAWPIKAGGGKVPYPTPFNHRMRPYNVLKSTTLAALLLLIVSPAAMADESAGAVSEAGRPAPLSVAAADAGGFGSRSLLTALEGHLRQRHVDLDTLTAEQMVDLMLDWVRVAPTSGAGGEPTPDALVFRYGGWSEGCATGFRLGLLRRTGTGDGPAQLAGITLMFEPSSGGDLAPFSTTTADWPTVAAFVEAIRRSPAYRRFGTEKPMSAFIERGGLR